MRFSDREIANEAVCISEWGCVMDIAAEMTQKVVERGNHFCWLKRRQDRHRLMC